MFLKGAMLALFNLGGGEIILVFTLILILWGGKRLPGLARGLGMGLTEFRKATRTVIEETDKAGSGFDAGQSLGGIYGRAAAEALTPDNQVAELYNPAALKTDEKSEDSWQPWIRLVQRRLIAVVAWLLRK